MTQPAWTHAPGTQAGLSLIELLIALALGLTLIMGLLQLFLASKQTYALQQQVAMTQENARFVIERLSTDVRQAGAYKCLDWQRLDSEQQGLLPPALSQPVSVDNGVLRLVSALSRSDSRTDLPAWRYGATWLLASDCQHRMRISDGPGLTLEAGEVLIPVRLVEYRLAEAGLQVRLHGRGRFDTLVEDVNGFELSFGLAPSPEQMQVAGDYQTTLTAQTLPRLRTVRLHLLFGSNGVDGISRSFTQVVMLRNPQLREH